MPAPIRVFTLTNGGSNVVGQSKASESAANAPTDDISSETDHTSTEAFRIKSGEDETLYFKTIPEYLDDVVEKVLLFISLSVSLYRSALTPGVGQVGLCGAQCCNAAGRGQLESLAFIKLILIARAMHSFRTPTVPLPPFS